MSGVAIGGVMAVGVGTIWAIAKLLRSGSASAVTGAHARGQLTEFADRSLELQSVSEILAFSGEATQAIFGASRVVGFESGADAAQWEASVPGQGSLGEVPAAMRGIFGWVRHNSIITAETDLGDARYGAMRGPLKSMMSHFDIDVLLPMVDRGSVLCVLGAKLGRKPTGQDRELMRLFRLQATAACANVRLHREVAQVFSLAREVDLASAVQAALVPAEREGADNQVAWAGDVRAAGDAVSDFWSVHPLVDGKVLAYVGDAVGVGLAGSMVSAVVKGCCDSILDAGPTRLAPSDFLGALNRALYRSTDPINTSCFVILIDKDRNSATYANAGHPAPYFIGKNGALRVLTGSGPFLGDLAESTYRGIRADDLAGGKLVLTTDGVVAAENAQRKPFGERRLQKLLTANAHAEPAVLRDLILDAVHKHTEGAVLNDDIAVVVVAVG